MKGRILQALKESDSYVSGQQLCEQFHVSRTAIWKVMEQLKKEGYEIEAVRNRGYRLYSSPDVISEAEIRSHLKTKWAGSRIICYDETDSTNSRAKDAGENGAPHGTLIVADRQSAGKGRRGRLWASPSGTGIYMSLLLRPDFSPEHSSMLTLVMGLSAAEAIRSRVGDKIGIKWPNDIVIGQKKVCGILTEMSTQIEHVNYVVIGVGINVNAKKAPEDLKGKATSLYYETGERYRRSSLIAAVLKCFEKNYGKFVKAGDLSGLVEKYNDLLVNRDRDVRIMDPKGEYEAHARGINEKGELLIVLPDGQEQAIYAGEVSVRGMYGYV